MKQLITFLFVLALFLGFSLQAQADLFNRGTDINGNRLIYDSDLNITWYDYTKSIDTWSNQLNWADALDVNISGTHYSDWRLPVSDSCGDYNCTGSEMGHLYYTELGNTAGGPLTYTGIFNNLQPTSYWSGLEYVANPVGAWVFEFYSGRQGTFDASTYALAVRDGDVAVVPEPISSILFVTGGTLLAGRRFLKRKKKA